MKKMIKKVIATFLVVAIILCSAPLSGLVGLDLPKLFDFTVKSVAETNVDSVKVGDTITFGTYNGEPIVWRCVDIDENGPLMLADDILCEKAFDASGTNSTYHTDGWGYIRERYGSNCWQDSNIRQWLNSDENVVSWTHCPPKSGSVTSNPYNNESGFLTNFTDLEKGYIKSVERIINVNIWETNRTGYCDGGSSDLAYQHATESDFNPKAYYYKNMSDSIFLLNAEQYNNIYKNNKSFLEASKPYWTCINWGNNYACYENAMRVDTEGRLGNYVVNKGEVGIRPAFYLNVDVSIEYPSGYDFEYDRYHFSNLDETIDVDIYKKAFGTQKGWLLYRSHEDSDIHGHCYGMTSTTAALLKYPSAINYFESYVEDCFTSDLIEVFPEYKNKRFNVDARTYIKYGYVYQFDSDVQKAEKKSQDDIVGLYNAVKQYVNGTGDPVIINVYHTNNSERKDGHSVFAIGNLEEDGKKYILINDSNIPYKVQKILIDTDSNSWDYTAYYIDDSNNTQTMYNYSSSNGVFTYSFPADVIYNVGLLLNSDSSEFLSTNKNLVSATNSISTNNTLEEILPATGGNTDSTSNKLYWAEEYAEEIQITALEDNSTVTVCDNNSSASVVMNTSESANFVVDDYDDSSVIVDCPDRENVDITFSSSNCSGDEVEIVVSATSTADQVTATLTDNGVEITGVTEGDVSLVKFDEIVESVTITETENTVEFETELPHAGHNFVDGVCTECGQRTIRLEEMSSQIRFDTNEDGSYAGTFDVRTRAKILDEDFNALIGSTNAEAEENIDSIGFVYTVNGENFSAESAQAVAQGKTVAGYVNAPVKNIQDCDGYYMFTCLVTDIPEFDRNYTLTAYAYICVNGKWYFANIPTNAEFSSLYSKYYPVAAEQYGWTAE